MLKAFKVILCVAVIIFSIVSFCYMCYAETYNKEQAHLSSDFIFGSCHLQPPHYNPGHGWIAARDIILNEWASNHDTTMATMSVVSKCESLPRTKHYKTGRWVCKGDGNDRSVCEPELDTRIIGWDEICLPDTVFSDSDIRHGKDWRYWVLRDKKSDISSLALKICIEESEKKYPTKSKFLFQYGIMGALSRICSYGFIAVLMVMGGLIYFICKKED